MDQSENSVNEISGISNPGFDYANPDDSGAIERKLSHQKWDETIQDSQESKIYFEMEPAPKETDESHSENKRFGRNFSCPKALNKELFYKSLPFIVLVGYLAYLIAVIIIQSEIQDIDFWCSGDGFLYVMTGVVGFGIIYFKVIKKYFGQFLQRELIKPIQRNFQKYFWKYRMARLITIAVLVGGVLAFYIIDTEDQRERLISFVGLIFLVAAGYVFSYTRRKVVWSIMIWGLCIQFILALLVLRWPTGNRILQCLSIKVTEFLNYSTSGATFVFGPLSLPYGTEGATIFAFTVLPVTIYFSFFTNILYYLGSVQWMVIKLGWLFKVTIGTSLCESMNAAGSIFLGMTESPLLVKPYLPIMTNSELHTIMTAGFATIAGSVMAAYIALGADAALLLTASVMNAPAALAISKLLYPDTEDTRINAQVVNSMKSNEVNALHAGCVGVANALPLVANIAANLIAFIACIAFLNAIFDWSCQLVNIDEGVCSIEGAFGYLFMPLAWMMGVQWSDAYDVGQLLGLKVIVNEFVAYSKLSEFIKAGTLSDRSEAIATFALCGFGNISAVGIMMGGLGPLAPDRKEDLAKVAFRAMIAGSMATLSSACIAGTLLSYTDDPHESSTMSPTTYLPQFT